MPAMMMATNAASKVSRLGVLTVAVALALLATRSNAFVSPPSIVNRVLPSQQQDQGQHRSNARSSRLFVSTASGSGIAVIDSWKLLPDGRIQGVMADSGDNVLTSPLKRKRGLKETSTVRTVSGSRYKLGTPASTNDNAANDKMSPARLGTPRATVPGVSLPGFNGNDSRVRATQPLGSTPTASQDRVLNEYMANKGRATLPMGSESPESLSDDTNEDDPDITPKKKNKFLTPLVGGASAIAVGAAIGSGFVSDKGIDLEKLKNLPDLTKVLESTKSLGLPDIKALRAPNIPSTGISLPKFEGVPSLPTPKLPEISMKLPKVNLPELKLPEAPSIKLNVPDGVKNFGGAAGGAIGDAFEGAGLKLPSSPFEKKPEVPPSVGMGPYRVPMPYLDQQIEDAKKEAAGKAEAVRIQKIKEEEVSRKKAEEAVIAQQARERELAVKQRTEEEARIRQEAEQRIQKAEQETALLRSEATKEAANLRAEVEKTRAEVEKTRAEAEKTQLEALKKEKAAAEETALLKKEAEAALLKERVAKEEFTQKLQAAEVAQLNQAKDFAAKLTEAQEAAAKERALADETAAADKLAEEAASREAVATAEVRRTSIGAKAARKATYANPSMSTYEEWQQRQQLAYQARLKEAAPGVKSGEPIVSSLSSSSSQDTLSTYKRWQQNVLAKQVVSTSTKPVTAAFVTGAPAPVTNQLVSGSTKLSEFATILNGDLGYTIAGSAALVGGITYGFSYQKIKNELAQFEETPPPPSSKNVAPPQTPSAVVQPLPPIVPPTPMVQAEQESATSATMAIDAKPYLDVLDDTSASVTKEISPRPPKGSYSPYGGPSPSAKSASVTTEVTKPPPAATSTPEANSNIGSYLESMSNVSGDKPSLKTSYSPFSNPKKTTDNNSMYNPPSAESSPIEEVYEEPIKSDVSDASVIGASYLESMSGPGDGLKASYSPFGASKATSSDDSLYNPPAAMETQPENVVSSPVDETNDANEAAESPVNGGSYFDSMARSDGSGEASVKTSYSPFGAPKTWQTRSDSLYDAPAAINVESSTSEPSTTDFSDSATSSQGSYLNGLNDDSNAPSGVKKSYSPFGTKPKAVSDNGLYSPGNSQ